MTTSKEESLSTNEQEQLTHKQLDNAMNKRERLIILYIRNRLFIYFAFLPDRQNRGQLRHHLHLFELVA